MPLSTDFDKLVTDQGKSDQEKKPFVFSRIHGVPKQIADSSNAIGFNERTIKNGLMSGVMQPSQIAHDRWLSVFDGLIDAFVFFLFMLIVSSLGVNIYVLPLAIGLYLYIFFHFVWWEHAMQWYFIETIIDYLNKTRNYYYGALIVFSVMFSTAVYPYLLGLNINDKIEFISEKINIFNEITSGVTNVASAEQINKNSPFSRNENEFSSNKSKNKVLQNSINTEDKKDQFNNDNDKNKNLSENKKQDILDSILTFVFFNLLHIIVMYYLFKYSKNYYESKKMKNIEGVDVELKTELEQKMQMLREKV